MPAIVALNRSIVAEMPHTTGTGGLLPAWPLIIRCTIVDRSRSTFMPLWASSRTRYRSTSPPLIVLAMTSHIEISRRLLPPWASPLFFESFWTLRK